MAVCAAAESQMANAYYTSANGAFARGTIPWVSADIRAILVDTGVYTFNAADDFLSDIAAGARISVLSASMASKTVADDGTMDAADSTWTSVTGNTAEAIVFYLHTGVEGTSQLIAYIDTGYTGLPVTPDGNNVTVTWPAAGVLKLGA